MDHKFLDPNMFSSTMLDPTKPNYHQTVTDYAVHVRHLFHVVAASESATFIFLPYNIGYDSQSLIIIK